MNSFSRVLLFLGLAVVSVAHSQQLQLLGLSEKETFERLGQPNFRYKDLQGQYVGDVFCIGGSYQSEIFIQGVGWEKETEMKPLQQFTSGPCKSPQKPISLYARFFQGKLAMAGYMAPHGNTNDRGWITFLDRLIVGDKTLNLPFKKMEEVFVSPYVKATNYARYTNGFSTQSFFPGSNFEKYDISASMVGVMWYAKNIRVNPQINPLTKWMVQQYVGFQ